MMNEKQAQKWENQRKGLVNYLLVFMLFAIPIMMITSSFFNYINLGYWLSTEQLETNLSRYASSLYGLVLGILIISFVQERRYAKYLESKKQANNNAS